MQTKIITCPDCDGYGFISGCEDNGIWSRPCDRCHRYGYIQVPLTNGDRIRRLSDKELADCIYDLNMEGTFCENRKECIEKMEKDQLTDEMCKKCLAEWLQKPVEEDEIPSGFFLDKQESGLTEED